MFQGLLSISVARKLLIIMIAPLDVKMAAVANIMSKFVKCLTPNAFGPLNSNIAPAWNFTTTPVQPFKSVTLLM